MADLAGAQLVAPIHHATFKLSDEPMTEPVEREEDRIALRQVERDRDLGLAVNPAAARRKSGCLFRVRFRPRLCLRGIG